MALSSQIAAMDIQNADIINHKRDRNGNLEVDYADGSRFTWDQFGNINWKSGGAEYSKDRHGEEILSSGLSYYKKDRFGSVSYAGKFSEDHTKKIDAYFLETGKTAPTRSLATILGLNNSGIVRPSNACNSGNYTKSDIIKYKLDRYGNLEVDYADGSEFSWDQFNNKSWKNGDIKYSKDRYGEEILSSGPNHYHKDRFGSVSFAGKFSAEHTKKIDAYLLKTGKTPPMCSLAVVLGLNIPAPSRNAIVESKPKIDEFDRDLEQALKLSQQSFNAEFDADLQEALKQSLVQPKNEPEQQPQKVEAPAENNDDDCIICMEEKRAANKLLSCGHMNMCAKCIDSIFVKGNKTCPTCRQAAQVITIFK
jgi:hypothetical protein